MDNRILLKVVTKSPQIVTEAEEGFDFFVYVMGFIGPR